MAMAGVSCTSLPLYSATAASQRSSHHVECSTTAPPRRGCSNSAVRAAAILSCVTSLGGVPPLGLAVREAQRRKDCGVFSTRCETSDEGTPEKIPFGYSRKDVILIGVGLTVFGVGLKYGLEERCSRCRLFSQS